jgi:ABC-2 type transport system permease protein
MAPPTYIAVQPALRERLLHQARILGVLARTDFKFKYSGSVLGYVWSVAKPLLYFSVLWIVFRTIFKADLPRYPLYLILGIVLWMFVADGVTTTLPSIVARGTILRRIWFPPIVIPVAATVTALMSFLINLAVVVVFIVISHAAPNPYWLLLLPLLAELYVFVLALCLIAATLYVRYRDIGQIWEVAASALFFSAPIVYPITVLPMWARHILAFNPFVQILQDVRRVVMGRNAHAVELIGHHGNHLIPLAVIVVLCVTAFVLYRRDSPRFAELA